MLRPSLMVSLAVLAGLGACAAPPAARPDASPDVLERVRAATGGAAWADLHRLHISSTLHAGGRDGREDRWEDVATGRFVREITLPPRARRQGYDGVAVWTTDDNGVAYALGDDDARLGAVDASYQVARAWWFPERRAGTRAAAGTRREGDRTFELVTITPEAGRPFTLWIDRATQFIDRIVEQQGEATMITRFADYRRVGAWTLPFTIRQGDGDAEHDDVETATKIEIDPAIPDEAFALPPVPAAAPDAAPDAAPVTIPFRIENNQILIDVLLDGHGPYEADFDSGGSLLVPPAVVAELQLGAAGATKQTGGGEGFVIGQAGRMSSVAIGGVSLHDVAFDSFAWDSEHPRRLLVGLEILQRYTVRLDFDRERMTLTPASAFRYTGDGAIVPFVFQDNQPLVTGAVDGIAATFAVDTGDNGSLQLMAPFARRHGFIERYHATVPYGGSAVGQTSGVVTRVGEVRLNGADGRPVARVRNPVAYLSTQTSGFDAHRYVAGNLGLGVLRQFNVVFDYARQRIVFEPNRHHGEPDVYNRSGLDLDHDAAGWTVHHVVAGGPGADARLEPGDVIVAIDGIAALDRATLRRLLKGPVGTRLALRVRGRAGERTVALVLRDVL